MSFFQYFIPGKEPEQIQKLEFFHDVQLAYAFDQRFIKRSTSQGPSGQRGTIVADTTTGAIKTELLGCWEDRGQQWRKVPGSPCWLGYYPKDLPAPESLRRISIVAGRTEQLGPQHWICPTARGWAMDDQTDMIGWAPRLPSRTEIDDNGRWVMGPVLPEYESLLALAHRFWDGFVELMRRSESNGEAADAPLTMSFDEENDACVMCLAHNYRISAVEAVVLGLLNGENRGKILAALVDLQTFMDYSAKKNSVAAGI